MTNNEKCIAQLANADVYCKEENGLVYVYVMDMFLELSQFEVDFRADLYGEELVEEFEED